MTFQSDFAIGGFMVPNDGISWSKDLRDFQLPVAEIERVSGLNFYPGVDKQRTADLCQADSCKLIKVSEIASLMSCLTKLTPALTFLKGTAEICCWNEML